MNKPSLLLYCQHSVGMGHLVRSLALGEGLAEYFRVVLLNGGPLPEGIRVPRSVEVIDLPALGLDSEMQLVGRDTLPVAEAQERRRKIILHAYHSLRPRALVIELFPFGRKKFAAELLPLLDAAHAQAAARPAIACSLRDILVSQRRDQQRHDDRAAEWCNRYFDAVLVHADSAFARLEETFHPQIPLQIPVQYTGFVLPEDDVESGPAAVERRILVSAGGGMVGEPLLRASLDAFQRIRESARVRLRLIAGPFLPEESWRALQAAAGNCEGVELVRSVPNLAAEMRASLASISQCGYNTCLDILRAGVPALVVPFGEGLENEQMNRARRFEQRGAFRVLAAQELNPVRLADEMQALLRFRPRPMRLELDGAQASGKILRDLVEGPARVLARTAATISAAGG